MSPPEDLRALITKAKDGDLEALTDLVATLEVRLLPFVRRGLVARHVEDPATAEAIVQETIFRLYLFLNLLV